MKITIEIEEISKVPKVKINGIEINGLIKIDLKWNTTCEQPISNMFSISHLDSEEKMIITHKEESL